MRIKGWTLVVAALFMAIAPGASAAKEQPERAKELLERVADAGQAPYRAHQLVVYFGEPQSAALLDVRSSSEGRFVRAESADGVKRRWPAEERWLRKASASIDVDPSDVLAKYAIEIGPTEELLGLDVVPLTLARRGDGVIVERWWVHAKSGVVYRRALYGVSGKVVGMATILEMDWGEPGVADPPDPDLDQVDIARAVPASGAPPRLAGAYDLRLAYELEIGGRPATQWVYSDGVHALSVFRTRGNLRPPDGFEAAEVEGRRVWVGPGPGTWAWQGAGWSYVAVAEESAIDAAELVEPFPAGGPSLGARLGSVWARLFGFLFR